MTTEIEPQWKAVFDPEQEIGGCMRYIHCEDNSWYVSVDEAVEATNHMHFDSLLDPRDPRLPLIALTHQGPFTLELHCTGCGEHEDYGSNLNVDHHVDCAPHAPTVETQVLTGPRLTRLWAAAIRESPLLDVVAPVADVGAVPHTIELRFEVTASPNRVDEIATALAAATGGTHTATFDQNWNEPA